MTMAVTAKNLDVGEALRSYVQERVVHTVEKFIGREPAGSGARREEAQAALGGTFRPVSPFV
jgi:hypothetical protein